VLMEDILLGNFFDTDLWTEAYRDLVGIPPVGRDREMNESESDTKLFVMVKDRSKMN
jgi:hypothetical protein